MSLKNPYTCHLTQSRKLSQTVILPSRSTLKVLLKNLLTTLRDTRIEGATEERQYSLRSILQNLQDYLFLEVRIVLLVNKGSPEIWKFLKVILFSYTYYLMSH